MENDLITKEYLDQLIVSGVPNSKKERRDNITYGVIELEKFHAETSHSQQTIANLMLDPKAILDFIEKARKSTSELYLEKMESDELARELDTLEAQAKSPKPKIISFMSH